MMGVQNYSRNPQITTANNSPANILVGTTIPVLVPQGQGSVFGTNPYTYENQQFYISLDVLPRVNDADLIMMKILLKKLLKLIFV